MGKKLYPPRSTFFYPEWSKGLPKCDDYENLLKVLKVLLMYVGAHLNRDVVLVGKIIRLGRTHVEKVSLFVL